MRGGSLILVLPSVALTAAALYPSAALAQAEGRSSDMIGVGAGEAAVDLFTRQRNVAVQDRPRPDYEARGGRFGLVMAYPRLEVATEATDNLYATSGGRTGEVIAHLRPELQLETDGPRHLVTAYARGVFSRHRRADSEDRDDFALGASAAFEARRLAVVSAGADFSHASEPRMAPGAPRDAASPIAFEAASAYAAASLVAGRVKLTTRGDLRALDYANGLDRAGRVIDQDARDRRVSSLTGRIDLAASPDTAVFLQATANRRDYDRPDPSGRPPRSSQGAEYLAGATFEVGARVRGEAAVGYLHQDFDDPAYEDAARFGGRARFEYFASPLTTLTLTAGRTVEDGASPGTGGYLASSASLTVDHELLRNLILTARLTWSAEDYQGAERADRRTGGRLGATLLLNRNLGLSLIATTLKTASTGRDRAEDFTVNRLSLSLVAQF